MTAGRISANIHLIRICLVFFSVQLYISYRISCIYSLCWKRRNPGMTILNCTYTIQGYVSSLSLVFLVCGVIICKCSVVPSICAYSTFECFFNASIGIFFICACSFICIRKRFYQFSFSHEPVCFSDCQIHHTYRKCKTYIFVFLQTDKFLSAFSNCSCVIKTPPFPSNFILYS